MNAKMRAARLASPVGNPNPDASISAENDTSAVPDINASFANNDANNGHTGAMIALVPQDSDIQRLAVPGGEPAEQLHLTLFFLGKGSAYDFPARDQIVNAARNIAGNLPPIEAVGQAITMFNPNGGDNGQEPCVVMLCTGTELSFVHDRMEELVQTEIHSDMVPEQHDPWTPHITLMYTDDSSMIGELNDRLGPVTFDTLRIAFAGNVTDIPLGLSNDDMDEQLRGAMDTRVKANPLSPDVEFKEVRHVRTPEGAKMYGRPIGSVIIDHGPGTGMVHLPALTHEASAYEGWGRYQATNGKHYDVGFDDPAEGGIGKFIATEADKWGKVASGNSAEEVLQKLHKKVAGHGGHPVNLPHPETNETPKAGNAEEAARAIASSPDVSKPNAVAAENTPGSSARLKQIASAFEGFETYQHPTTGKKYDVGYDSPDEGGTGKYIATVSGSYKPLVSANSQEEALAGLHAKLKLGTSAGTPTAPTASQRAVQAAHAPSVAKREQSQNVIGDAERGKSLEKDLASQHILTGGASANNITRYSDKDLADLSAHYASSTPRGDRSTKYAAQLRRQGVAKEIAKRANTSTPSTPTVTTRPMDTSSEPTNALGRTLERAPDGSLRKKAPELSNADKAKLMRVNARNYRESAKTEVQKAGEYLPIAQAFDKEAQRLEALDTTPKPMSGPSFSVLNDAPLKKVKGGFPGFDKLRDHKGREYDFGYDDPKEGGTGNYIATNHGDWEPIVSHPDKLTAYAMLQHQASADYQPGAAKPLSGNQMARMEEQAKISPTIASIMGKPAGYAQVPPGKTGLSQRAREKLEMRDDETNAPLLPGTRRPSPGRRKPVESPDISEAMANVGIKPGSALARALDDVERDRVNGTTRRPRATPKRGVLSEDEGIVRKANGEIVHTVTLPNGETATRMSKTREYTHAIMVTMNHHQRADEMELHAASRDAALAEYQKAVATGDRSAFLLKNGGGNAYITHTKLELGDHRFANPNVKATEYQRPFSDEPVKESWSGKFSDKPASEIFAIDRKYHSSPQEQRDAYVKSTIEGAQEWSAKERADAEELRKGPKYSYHIGRWTTKPQAGTGHVGANFGETTRAIKVGDDLSQIRHDDEDAAYVRTAEHENAIQTAPERIATLAEQNRQANAVSAARRARNAAVPSSVSKPASDPGSAANPGSFNKLVDLNLPGVLTQDEARNMSDAELNKQYDRHEAAFHTLAGATGINEAHLEVGRSLQRMGLSRINDEFTRRREDKEANRADQGLMEKLVGAEKEQGARARARASTMGSAPRNIKDYNRFLSINEQTSRSGEGEKVRARAAELSGQGKTPAASWRQALDENDARAQQGVKDSAGLTKLRAITGKYTHENTTLDGDGPYVKVKDNEGNLLGGTLPAQFGGGFQVEDQARNKIGHANSLAEAQGRILEHHNRHAKMIEDNPPPAGMIHDPSWLKYGSSPNYMGPKFISDPNIKIQPAAENEMTRLMRLKPYTQNGPDFNRDVRDNVGRYTNAHGAETQHAWLTKAEVSAGLRPASDVNDMYLGKNIGAVKANIPNEAPEITYLRKRKAAKQYIEQTENIRAAQADAAGYAQFASEDMSPIAREHVDRAISTATNNDELIQYLYGNKLQNENEATLVRHIASTIHVAEEDNASGRKHINQEERAAAYAKTHHLKPEATANLHKAMDEESAATRVNPDDVEKFHQKTWTGTNYTFTDKRTGKRVGSTKLNEDTGRHNVFAEGNGMMPIGKTTGRSLSEVPQMLADWHNKGGGNIVSETEPEKREAPRMRKNATKRNAWDIKEGDLLHIRKGSGQASYIADPDERGYEAQVTRVERSQKGNARTVHIHTTKGILKRLDGYSPVTIINGDTKSARVGLETKGVVITPGGRVGDDSKIGTPQKDNWVDKSAPGSLPQYIRIVRNGLMKNGHSESEATALAVASMKKWAHGGGNVTPKVQAAASAALAQWEAMRAAAHGGGK